MILLISDLHLHEERPDITGAFLAFLEQYAQQAQALYILGDFFEVWIGDDAMTPFQHSIAAALHQVATQGTQIYLMHGNRDFLIGKKFCQLAQCKLLQDPSLVSLAGEQVLLMHGDSLCTSDHSYIRLRKVLRNPLVLFVLRHLPLRTRQRLAGDLRQKSKTSTRMKAMNITDVNPEAVEQVMQQHQVRTLIHGHTHRPAVHNLTDNKRRIVLGDWENQGWFLQVTQADFALKTLSFPKSKFKSVLSEPDA
ncbi:UDP-2,3-diacylglucosamine diphosphatase [Denitrificimonas sp. JX-1]|uniref:UDP-2,3-diacylglucosamine hydrolase n=1 Tax=Denitrificimonas halotolerans TaxID=3098930 RepID=A0ABU5GPN3_9GAMM|nr:UDP-2,3-diacylglucosamine diphosphatase [Denitrificimonas sp. JX-1]MDY7218903.1 UDP-2,3-diacylglucosamine diphosphatase [Denitrificimonas sp. JX-1]